MRVPPSPCTLSKKGLQKMVNIEQKPSFKRVKVNTARVIKCFSSESSWKPKTQPNSSSATAALLSFGWVFSFQLDSLEKHLITLAVVAFTLCNILTQGTLF